MSAFELSDKVRDNLKSLELDAGQNFLSGKATSVFSPENILSNAGGINGLAALGLTSGMDSVLSNLEDGTLEYVQDAVRGAVDPVLNSDVGQSVITSVAMTTGTILTGIDLVKNAPTLLEDTILEITKDVTDHITKSVAGKIAEYASNHATSALKLPTEITSNAMQYFNEHKKSVGEVLDELFKSQEESNDSKLEEQDQSGLSKFMSQAQTKLSYVKKYTDEYTNKMTSYISMIGAYIQQGPSWVEGQINNQVDSVLKFVNEKIDSQWEQDKKMYENFAYNQGQKRGKKLVDAWDRELEKAQQAIKAKNETQLKKLATKKHVILQQAKLKIMAQTGINLPV